MLIAIISLVKKYVFYFFPLHTFRLQCSYFNLLLVQSLCTEMLVLETASHKRLSCNKLKHNTLIGPLKLQLWAKYSDKDYFASFRTLLALLLPKLHSYLKKLVTY